MNDFVADVSYFRRKTKSAMFCKSLICMLLLLSGMVLSAQNIAPTEAVMRFLGSEDLQELDADEVEKLEYLLDDKARINMLSEQELRSCGLFTSYQAAVIRDYIGRHGPIRSLLELSMLDGFGDEYIARAAPFISLSVLEQGDSKVRHELAARAGFKWQAESGSDGSYGFKYRIKAGDRLVGSIAASRSYGCASWTPSALSVSLAWKSARRPLRVILGDFNARFGQGLTLWNNSFLTSLTTPDSFIKRPSGLAQPWSFTGNGALTGVAVEAGFGKVQISVMAALEGLKDAVLQKDPPSAGRFQIMPALNVAWYGRHGQVSFSNVVSFPLVHSTPKTTMKTGLDAAFCMRGVNVFGEVAYDWIAMIPKALAGTRFKIGEKTDMAVQARAFVQEEYGLSCSGMHSLASSTATWIVDFTTDSNGNQVKSQITYEKVFNERWKLKFRLSERVRTWGLKFRTDARADVTYTKDIWHASMRLNVLNCDQTGVLSYMEGGYSGDKLTAYLRQGIFFIDDWDDRIYVYERDAPGAFNVPAMYGRGVWTSATASAKFTSSLRLYARASFVSYPFMQKKKPGKAELKLQLQWRF